MGFWDDPFSVLVLAPALALAIWARRRLRSACRRTATSADGSAITGAALAAVIMEAEGASATLVTAAGPLATFYDPGRRELRLSAPVAEGHSVSALGLAAHEAGHALQQSSPLRLLLRLRTPLVFASGLGALAAWLMMLTSVLIGFFHLFLMGALLYSAAATAPLLLLPLERDANRRARLALEKTGLVADVATIGPVMDAVAWAHVAATLPLFPVEPPRPAPAGVGA
jgi:Zn-dependent membrane protease YugP